MKRNRWFTLLLALGASTLHGGLASAGTQNAKILAINDFHGQISEGLLVSNRPVGTAPVLAAYLEDAMAGMEDRTLIVATVASRIHAAICWVSSAITNSTRGSAS